MVMMFVRSSNCGKISKHHSYYYSQFVLAAAYFDSVDGRTPPRWSSTSLSRSQTALADLDEVVF